MVAWKQLVLCLVVLVIGAALWIGFVPSARETLAGWGLDIPALAATAPETGTGAAGGNAQAAAGRRATTVVAMPTSRKTINDRLSAIGTGEAVRSVVVLPFVSGRIVEIRVASGDMVAAGDVIANLDADNERITVDRMRIALADAQNKLERANALRSSNTVAAVSLEEARLVVENARLALQEAELTLERRAIVAPIDGIVGILPVEIGDYVTSQSQIVTLDDRSELLVDFWVPERFAGALKVGAPVSASSVARPNESFTGEVSALDNRIDAASRTLHVQARIDNPQDTLRAGMSFQVRMSFPGDTFPSVDPLAIQWNTEGAYVWAVRDGKAERVPVKVIQRNTDSVLVDADLTDGRQIVTEGLATLRDGDDVAIANADRPAPVATTQVPGSGS